MKEGVEKGVIIRRFPKFYNIGKQLTHLRHKRIFYIPFLAIDTSVSFHSPFLFCTPRLNDPVKKVCIPAPVMFSLYPFPNDVQHLHQAFH